MVHASEVLNYTGNAALGLNDTKGIDQYGDTDTKDLNTSVYNLAYLNMQKNKAVWEQKIKDRDDGMVLIAQGQDAVNDALPEDREKLMAKLAEVKKVYFDNGGDVKSDPRVWLDLNSKMSDFTGANTIAKSRLKTYNSGMLEAAKETNPVKKRQMIDHWKKEKEKDIYQPFDPYQQTLDYDVAKTLPGVKLIHTPSKRDGDYDVEEVKTDSAKSYDDYLLQYLTNDKGETAPNIDAHYDDFFGVNGSRSEDAVVNDVAITNQKLKKIATIEGFDVTDPSKLPERFRPIQVMKMPDGSMGVTDRKDVAMAKLNLAMNYKNETKRTLNPKYAQIDKEKAQAKVYDAQRDATHALASQRRSVIPLNQAKAKYWNAKAAPQENANKVYNIFDDVLARSKKANITVSGTGKSGNAASNTTQQDIVLAADMPPGFQQVLGGVDKDGKPVKVKPLKDSHGVEYYIKGKSSFLTNASGVRFSEATIVDAFNKQSDFHTFDEFKKHLLDDMKYTQDDELQGLGGTATAQSTVEALRALNNKNRSKEDEVLFQMNDNTNDNGDQQQ